ncbi:STAS domain-containing protein [Kurthia gibsonii]|nr:STAS domain-containing protein [Kurthia gibsonii]
MENVLHAVVSNKSEVVLIDITGLLVLDTVVAHHLIEVVNAIHIVGGKSMLVGIRPEIAQTIVQLGVNLSDVTTLGTLQEGIEKALEETNRCIREVIH